MVIRAARGAQGFKRRKQISGGLVNAWFGVFPQPLNLPGLNKEVDTVSGLSGEPL